MATENKKPGLFDKIEPESLLRVQNPGWAGDQIVRALSSPTKELVGIFPQEIIEEVEDPWMFTGAPDDEIHDLVYLLGGDDGVVRVAFGETAARKGVVHRIDERDISIIQAR